MIQSVEAEIDVHGRVTLLKPLRLPKPCRAIVTVLEEDGPIAPPSSNAAAMLAILESPEFAQAPCGSPEEMEAMIQENRAAWEA